MLLSLMAQQLPGGPLRRGPHPAEVHIGVVDALQVVVHGLGLGQGGHRLLHQGGRHLSGEGESGLVPPQQLPVCHGVHPQAAVRVFGIGRAAAGGDKGQGELGQDEVLQPVGCQRRGAGDHVPARRHGAGENVGEEQVAEAVGVHQLIDPPALALHGAELHQEALVGDGGEEALAHLSLPLAAPAALPGQDALGPFGDSLLQLRGLDEGGAVGGDLGCRPQAAVGPGVAALVALHGPLQLPADLL